MKFSLKHGTYSTVLALLASVAFFLFPDQRWIAYLTGCLTVLLFITNIQWNGRDIWQRLFQSSEEWVPLHAALKHLALTSQWSFAMRAIPVSQAELLLKSEFLERLARHEIRARGKSVLAPLDQTVASATEEISAEFWPYAFIQVFGEIVISDAQRGVAFTDSQFCQVPKKSYRGVIVSKADVVRVWPRRWLPWLGKRKSPFWQGIENHRLGIDQNPNFDFEDEFFLRTAGNAKTDC